jgi:hypothetical protein
MKLLIMQFSPISSHFISLFRPSILLSTLFSNTHTEPQATIMVLYILIFMFLRQQTRRQEGFGLNGNKHYPNSLSLLLIFS